MNQIRYENSGSCQISISLDELLPIESHQLLFADQNQIVEIKVMSILVAEQYDMSFRYRSMCGFPHDEMFCSPLVRISYLDVDITISIDSLRTDWHVVIWTVAFFELRWFPTATRFPFIMRGAASLELGIHTAEEFVVFLVGAYLTGRKVDSKTFVYQVIQFFSGSSLNMLLDEDLLFFRVAMMRHLINLPT